jgi:hypothetical protein
MDEAYESALQAAVKELAECDAKADQLERRRAQLRQTIAVLQTQLGNDVRSNESMTEAILTITKAANDFITASEVVERLLKMRFNASSASVATILSRLTKAGTLLYGIGAGGNGYMWNGTSNESSIQRFKRLTDARKRVSVVPETSGRRFRTQ